MFHAYWSSLHVGPGGVLHRHQGSGGRRREGKEIGEQEGGGKEGERRGRGEEGGGEAGRRERGKGDGDGGAGRKGRERRGRGEGGGEGTLSPHLHTVLTAKFVLKVEKRMTKQVRLS